MITFLLPFKGMQGAKTRWTLPEERRQSALLSLLHHNLLTVASVVGRESTVLVCPTPIPATWKLPAVRHFLSHGGGLNSDLHQARDTLSGSRPESKVAVLLPDLPKLQASDIEAMLAASSQADVVLCPDHHRVGTNGLLFKPAFALDFLFEGESFKRHQKEAEEKGLTVAVLERRGLAHDADKDEDLRRVSLL